MVSDKIPQIRTHAATVILEEGVLHALVDHLAVSDDAQRSPRVCYGLANRCEFGSLHRLAHTFDWKTQILLRVVSKVDPVRRPTGLGDFAPRTIRVDCNNLVGADGSRWGEAFSLFGLRTLVPLDHATGNNSRNPKALRPQGRPTKLEQLGKGMAHVRVGGSGNVGTLPP